MEYVLITCLESAAGVHVHMRHNKVLAYPKQGNPRCLSGACSVIIEAAAWPCLMQTTQGMKSCKTERYMDTLSHTLEFSEPLLLCIANSAFLCLAKFHKSPP